MADFEIQVASGPEEEGSLEQWPGSEQGRNDQPPIARPRQGGNRVRVAAVDSMENQRETVVERYRVFFSRLAEIAALPAAKIDLLTELEMNWFKDNFFKRVLPCSRRMLEVLYKIVVDKVWQLEGINMQQMHFNEQKLVNQFFRLVEEQRQSQQDKGEAALYSTMGEGSCSPVALFCQWNHDCLDCLLL
mmetsp:Transcript_38104/g.59425  ORF Transcript_38104/g.59425 Transcript_38104/m.59425 type:complete len:189 (+) Transcript_38104:190-756(+)